jgi:RimJ/RimL family protein N-acetyltransferase
LGYEWDVSIEPPAVLSGPRLDLHLLTIEQLLSRDVGQVPIELPFNDPNNILDPDNSPIRFRIPQVRANPHVNPWLIRLAVERQSNTIVGLTNFHDAPDSDGMVEIGYRVSQNFRRQGYGREMALIMWDFAATHPDVKLLRASVSPTNAPSLAIIEGAGFSHVGEQDDPDDGLEYIYDMTVADYRAMRQSATE